MTTLLDRYNAGEYEQVWKELVDLGGQVREEPTASYAAAVARELMLRVRSNVELLIMKLIAIDYKFNEVPLVTPPEDETAQALAAIEATCGLLPIALRECYRLVGAIDFTGTHPDWPSGARPDPLFIAPLWFAKEECAAQIDDEDRIRAGLPICIPIAPDRDAKSGYSGGGPYEMALPCGTIDGPLLNTDMDVSFVEYLRLSLAWGGFPGLRDTHGAPAASLRLLREGIVPF